MDLQGFLGRRSHSRVTMMVVATGLCIVSAFAFTQEAQEPREADDLVVSDWFGVAPEFRDRIDIDVGSVDVTVLDKKGRQAVSGLPPEAFVLLVDGEPREISNFTAYGQSSLPQAAGDSSSPLAARRAPRELTVRPHLFVIFVDNENITRPNRNFVLNRLDDFVHEFVHPPHRALVVINNPGLRRVGRATSDADEVMRNLEGLVGTTTGATKTRTYHRFAEMRIRELGAAQSQNRISVVDLEQALSTARMNSAQTDDSVLQSIDTLKTLIQTISGAPGRKDVLYVSDGIPRSPGRELFLLVDELFRVHDGMQQTQERDRMSLFLQVVAYARAADVTVHVVDASGLHVDHGSRAETAWYRTAEFEIMRRENYQAPLFFLAGQTGGIAVVNTNEIEKGLETVGDAAKTYYSLGFPLDAPVRDRTHRIEIRLPDHPDYELHYRPAFRERTAATRTAERTMTGLLLDLDDNPIGIVAEAGEALPAGDERWTIPVVVHAPASTLTLLPAGDELVGKVSTFCVAGSDAGAKSKVQHSSQEIRIPAERVNDIATVSFKIEVETEPGTERISVGVLDEISGATGYTVVEVRLPDGNA